MEEIELPGESLDIEGHLSIIELPHDMTDEELADWLNPVTELGDDGLYHVVKPAKISQEERARRTVLEAKNIITNAGISLLLNNMSVPGQGLMQPFAQIFGVGNGAISGVTRADTTIAGDGFASGSRKVPASFSIIGFTTTITTNFGSADAVGTWTNAALVGFKVSGAQQASTTAGTGALMSHVLMAYVKGASAIAASYSFSLSN